MLLLVNLVNTYYGQYTRVIRIKQGALKGIISDPITNLNLKSVEQFLGIPYASPPIGEMRFMPPGTAPPWNGLKVSSIYLFKKINFLAKFLSDCTVIFSIFDNLTLQNSKKLQI